MASADEELINALRKVQYMIGTGEAEFFSFPPDERSRAIPAGANPSWSQEFGEGRQAFHRCFTQYGFGHHQYTSLSYSIHVGALSHNITTALEQLGTPRLPKDIAQATLAKCKDQSKEMANIYRQMLGLIDADRAQTDTSSPDHRELSQARDYCNAIANSLDEVIGLIEARTPRHDGPSRPH